MRVMGLDLSITSPGIVIIDEHRVLAVANPKTTPADGSDVERADYIAARVCELLAEIPVDCIGVENYAFAKRTNMSRLGELGGIVKHQAWLTGGYDDRSWMKFSSMSVKKFATGYGKAGKFEMIKAAAPHLGGFHPRLQKSDDVADALWVAKLCMSRLVA